MSLPNATTDRLAQAASCIGKDGREEDGETLRAKKVESELELIGGPLAHGQIGDYLIEILQVKDNMVKAVKARKAINS